MNALDARRLDRNKRPERRSAGDGRGANEKPGLPFSQNENRFGDGRKRSELHDDNYGGSSDCGHGSVHDDAELAMVRICLIRMKVSDLSNGQHGKQNKAQPGDRKHQAAARVEFQVQMCPDCCQNGSPTTQGYTTLDALSA
jgi:hypothetical protein